MASYRSYGREHWGCDGLLLSYPKLFIKDILRIPASKEHPRNIFMYRNHPISTVDILGVITKVDERNKIIIYTIDDGTGAISCTVFKTTNKHDALRSIRNEIPEGPLMRKYEELLKEKERLSESFEHGQLLHVKGVLQIYQDFRCIKVYECAVVKDAMAEVHRIHEMLKLYKRFYDKPFTLTDTSHQLNASGLKKVKPEIFCQDTVRQLILDEIYKQQLESLTHQRILELLTHDLLQKVTEDPARLEVTLQGLERTGHIYRDPTEAEYQVSQYCKYFQRSILEVITKNSSNRNGINYGYHFAGTFNEIRKLRPFSQTNRYGLWICLRQLERQSDIAFYDDVRFVLVS